MPAHDSMLFKVPDSIPDEVAVLADPFAVSLHAITRHPPPRGGRVLVYGAGALGGCAVAILRALHPDVEVGVVARFGAQAALAHRLGATRVFAHAPVKALIEEAAAWSGGVLRGQHELPMAYPGGIDVVYDTITKKESLEVSVCLLRARGTLVKAGVHGPTSWEWTPLLQGDLLGRLQRVRDRGGRGRASARHPPLPRPGRIRPRRHRTDAHPYVCPRRLAGRLAALATQDDSGAIKVAFDQRP